MKGGRGFTLVEVLLAVGLAALLMASLSGVLRNTVRLWRGVRDRARLDQRARVVFDRLGRELRNCVPLPGQGFQGTTKEVSFHAVLPGEFLEAAESPPPRLARVSWREGSLEEGEGLIREERSLSWASFIGEGTRRSEIGGTAAFSFAMPGTDEQGVRWKESWDLPDQTPKLVKVSLSLAQGGATGTYEMSFLLPSGEAAWTAD